MTTINKEDIYNALNAQLLSKKGFESFKWVKSKSSLIHKNTSSKIVQSIKFELYETVRDADSDDLGYDLTVILGVRFDVLYKWFEKFYQGSTLKDLRNWSTFMEFMYLNDEYQIFFYKNGVDFDSDIEKTVAHILEKSTLLFDLHTSLEQVYRSKVLPILTGEMKTSSLEKWFQVFEYLAICKLIEPENFDKLEAILYHHFKALNDRKEPNVIHYFPIYRDIINELRKENTL